MEETIERGGETEVTIVNEKRKKKCFSKSAMLAVILSVVIVSVYFMYGRNIQYHKDSDDKFDIQAFQSLLQEQFKDHRPWDETPAKHPYFWQNGRKPEELPRGSFDDNVINNNPPPNRWEHYNVGEQPRGNYYDSWYGKLGLGNVRQEATDYHYAPKPGINVDKVQKLIEGDTGEDGFGENKNPQKDTAFPDRRFKADSFNDYNKVISKSDLQSVWKYPMSPEDDTKDDFDEDDSIDSDDKNFQETRFETDFLDSMNDNYQKDRLKQMLDAFFAKQKERVTSATGQKAFIAPSVKEEVLNDNDDLYNRHNTGATNKPDVLNPGEQHDLTGFKKDTIDDNTFVEPNATSSDHQFVRDKPGHDLSVDEFRKLLIGMNMTSKDNTLSAPEKTDSSIDRPDHVAGVDAFIDSHNLDQSNWKPVQAGVAPENERKPIIENRYISDDSRKDLDTKDVGVFKEETKNYYSAPNEASLKAEDKTIQSVQYPRYMHLYDWATPIKDPDSAECVKMQTLSSYTSVCIHDVEVDTEVSAALKSKGVWEFSAVRDVQLIVLGNEGAVFIDIGAGIGVFSLAVASMLRKVIAIEPFLPHVKMFHQSVLTNKMESYVTLFRNVISSREEDMIVTQGEGGINSVDIKPISPFSTFSNKDVVPAITLNDLANAIPFKKAVLKIDTPGFVIRALTHSDDFFANIDVVSVITHWNKSDERLCNFLLEFLYKQKGYRPFKEYVGKQLDIKHASEWQCTTVVWMKLSNTAM